MSHFSKSWNCLALILLIPYLFLLGYAVAEQKTQTITVPATSKHERTLIWLHGLGDTAAGFARVFQSAEASCVDSNTKVVLLTAPRRSVTINNGQKMTSWYDIRSTDKSLADGDRISQAEVEDSYRIIASQIDAEVALLNNDSTRVYVGGFSQGSSMSYYIAVNYPKQLGGIIALSGSFFAFVSTDSVSDNRFTNLPIYAGHGDKDQMVSLAYAKKGYERLQAKFTRVSLVIESNLAHSVSQEQLIKIKQWYTQLQVQKKEHL